MVKVDIRLRELPKLGDPTKYLCDPTKDFVGGCGKGSGKKRTKSKRR